MYKLAHNPYGVPRTAFATEDDLWVVTSEGGSTFNDVPLTEPDWCEYDEANDASVEISEIVFDVVSGSAGAKKGGGKRTKAKKKR